MKKLSAVVLAGGYGYFFGPRKTKISKVLAHLENGKPMLCHILDKLISTELFSRFYVVTNTDYHDQITHALSGYQNIRYATQPHRLGSAGAVQLALNLADPEEEHFLTHYGDMPCFELETYRLMVKRHLEDNPALTMLTVPHVPGTPVETYGRVIFDSQGEILGTIDDPNCVPEGAFQEAKEVNPSLYVGNAAWMREYIPRIKPSGKNDGYPDERLMQSLVHIAHKERARLARVRIDDHEQAHGVNKLHELRLARLIHRRRCHQRTPAAA